ncbi:MAG: bifunctional DNA primase/polymerase [Acidimicrobiales bacterium]
MRFRSSLDAALAYAAAGWLVLPIAGTARDACTCGKGCGSPAKHPLTCHGVHDASTDEGRLRQWWRRWPWANVGIATGHRSGVVVVDVDPVAGGRWSIEAIRAEGYDLPVTLLAFSGGGGFHLFYSVPADVRVRNTVGQLPNVGSTPGIDLRGDGGYVVAAPSLHVSGGRYRWSERAGEMRPLPLWLARPVRAAPDDVRATRRDAGGSRYGSAALADELDGVRRLTVGQRKDGLNRASYSLGRLVAGGELAADLVYEELLAAAVATGLPEREASRTINSGLRAGATRPPRSATTAGTDGVGMSEIAKVDRNE